MKTKERLTGTVSRLNLDVVELQQSYQELKELGGPEKKEGEDGFKNYVKYYQLSLACIMAMDKIRTEAKILKRVANELS